MSKEEILLISYDPSTVEIVKEAINQSNITIKIKKDIGSGLKVSRDFQIVLIDTNLSDGDCLDCLQNLNDLNTDLISIVMVDRNKRDVGINALLNHAFFYIMKPLNRYELKHAVNKAFEFKKLRKQNKRLYDCTIEEFLRNKLKDYLSQIQRVGGIALYDTVVSEVERALLTLAIEETGGNQLQASKLLGLNRNTVRNKVKKYKINPS